mgnify:FL=1
MLKMFLEKKKINYCHSCNGQGWISEIVSRVPLKTVTDSCKRCNQDKIPNPNYRTGKLI